MLKSMFILLLGFLLIDPSSTSRIGGDFVCQLQEFEKVHVPRSKIPRDKQREQMHSAQCLAGRNGHNGVFRDQEDIAAFRPSLVRIRDNHFFELDKLTHSQPYLLPEAAELLDTIGARFLAEQQRMGLDYGFRIVVTSVTRSQADQDKLRRRNRNATRVSTHSFGTTFDISYVQFRQPFLPQLAEGLLREAGYFNPGQRRYILTRTLDKVISDLHREGRLHAIKERRQPCYHVTAKCL